MAELEVAENDRGRTLGAVVKAALGVPWSRARDLIATGRVLIDGAVVRDDARRLEIGMKIEVRSEARRELRGVLAPESLLYFDADVAVVHKDAGVLTVPFDDERDTLVDRTRALLARIDKSRGRKNDESLGVVQRLDKDTTGVLVFARSFRAKRSLDLQIRAHTVDRIYTALVHGVPDDTTVTTDIVQDRGDGLRGSWGTRPNHRGPAPEEAKRSTTHIRVLERFGTRASRIECRLETGRQHQIRIHLSELGSALLGEPVYIRDHRGPRIAAPRPMLHARTLAFDHPGRDERLRFEAPPPADFAAVLEALRTTEPEPR